MWLAISTITLLTAIAFGVGAWAVQVER